MRSIVPNVATLRNGRHAIDPSIDGVDVTALSQKLLSV